MRSLLNFLLPTVTALRLEAAAAQVVMTGAQGGAAAEPAAAVTAVEDLTRRFPLSAGGLGSLMTFRSLTRS